MSNLEELKSTIMENYRNKTPRSYQCNLEAMQFIPSGDTRAISYHQPYPLYGDRGQGCYIYDYDGNRYLDLCNCMTAMIHGHAHPYMVEKMKEQLEKGTTHAIPSESQYKLAEMICKRVPSVDKIRFTNTGSEATLFAMRVARAFTGKDIVIKVDGGYHGCHDYAQVNQIANFLTDPPMPYISTPGVPEKITDDMRVVDFNDLEGLEKMLEQEKGRVAAFILEPVLGVGGGCAPEPGYLEGVRALTEKHGVLLIFDEIISFRLSEGGMQKKAGVKPDITAFGKIIGGGLSIGAIGGREEIMKLFDPREPGYVNQSGTFTGNAMVMVGGLASLELLNQQEIDRIDALGSRLASTINKNIQTIGIEMSARQIGSMMALIPAGLDQPLRNSREVIRVFGKSVEFMLYLYLDLLNRGVNYLHRGLFAVSTPMDEKLIEGAAVAISESLEYLKPFREAIG